jgi:hypothetical protein
VVAVTGIERWSLRLARFGLVVIALVTFITSFDAVSAVGAERGAVSPALAWAIPLALDGLIVVASAIAWLESLRGGRWHPFPVALVAIAGGLSVAANVAHASGTDPLARALAAVPPIALLAAVELGAWQLRREAHRDTPTTPTTYPVGEAERGGWTGEHGEQDRSPVLGDGEHLRSLPPGDDPAGEQGSDAVSVLWERIAVEVERLDAKPSQQAIADRLGVSRARVQRAIAANRDAWDQLAVVPSRNGHRPDD